MKKKFLLTNITNYFNYVSIRDALHLRKFCIFLANERETAATWKMDYDQQGVRLQIQVCKVCVIVRNTVLVSAELFEGSIQITTTGSACYDYSS